MRTEPAKLVKLPKNYDPRTVPGGLILIAQTAQTKVTYLRIEPAKLVKLPNKYLHLNADLISVNFG